MNRFFETEDSSSRGEGGRFKCNKQQIMPSFPPIIFSLDALSALSSSCSQVYAKASLCDNPDELLRQVTGEPMRPMALVEHLRQKYSELYGL